MCYCSLMIFICGMFVNFLLYFIVFKFCKSEASIGELYLFYNGFREIPVVLFKDSGLVEESHSPFCRKPELNLLIPVAGINTSPPRQSQPLHLFKLFIPVLAVFIFPFLAHGDIIYFLFVSYVLKLYLKYIQVLVSHIVMGESFILSSPS